MEITKKKLSLCFLNCIYLFIFIIIFLFFCSLTGRAKNCKIVNTSPKNTQVIKCIHLIHYKYINIILFFHTVYAKMLSLNIVH